jgi:hypothetical protein
MLSRHIARRVDFILIIRAMQLSSPGLNELPFSICGFIDDTIDPILVPFSGPAGDYEGAPCRPQYILAQELVYSGYKKLHGHKMETV